MSDPKSTRALFVFQVPAKLSKEIGVKTIGMVELTPAEEIMSSKTAGNEAYQLAYNLAMQSIRKLDDRAVTTADGSAEEAFRTIGPKGRTLVINAYNRIHQPEGDDTADFLASMQTVVR
jgi:hypothetical protein